jgi:enterochelin esterase family protein
VTTPDDPRAAGSTSAAGAGRGLLDGGPSVAQHTVTFRLADPPQRLAGVRLWLELPVPGDQRDLRWAAGVWSLTVPRPDVDRLEYLFELDGPAGRSMATDPGNPRRVGGAFGEHSVLELPGYRPPWWLERPAEPGRRQMLAVPARSLGTEIPVTLWSPAGLPDRAEVPLLVAHDGPEYDDLSSLTTYLSVLVADGRIPPVRAALLGPGARDDWYSASNAYGRALCLAVLPRLRDLAPTTRVVGMGASLGALAMLHAQRRHPGSIDALFLQSGSFFHRRHDAHERRFGHYDRIARAVDQVLRAPRFRDPVPAVLTCGLLEESLANNRIMTRALGAQGYGAVLHEVRDVHNYTAWRDAFDPHLTGLLAGPPIEEA